MTLGIEPPAAMQGAPEGGEVRDSGSVLRLVARTFLENRLALVGLVSVVLVTLFCFVGPLFYKTDQVHSNLLAANLPPGGAYPIGTDQNGFDILGRLMAGGQSS